MSQIFGLEGSRKEAKLLLLPIPWEVTTSYGGGASKGPLSILKASSQLDLQDYDFGSFYKAGIFLDPPPEEMAALNAELKPLAQMIIKEWDQTAHSPSNFKEQLDTVNSGCEKMNSWVFDWSQKTLSENHLIGFVGGDHSSILGGIRAISEHLSGDFGILQIDAHADLRKGYQGFKNSHASIMRNIMELPVKPQRLIQVGVRDYCEEEDAYIKANEGNVHCFYDRQIKQSLFEGENWRSICHKIISKLPQNVYISFDIDGLSPEHCPGTGTPVPGGLSFDQAIQLITDLVQSGRQVVGFDLCEVAPSPHSEWDGNIGARVLYKLCGASIISNTIRE